MSTEEATDERGERRERRGGMLAHASSGRTKEQIESCSTCRRRLYAILEGAGKGDIRVSLTLKVGIKEVGSPS